MQPKEYTRKNIFRLMIWLISLCCIVSCDRSSSPRPSNKNAVERSGGKRVPQDLFKTLKKVDGHRVYVSVYSHIYHQQDDIFKLTNTLSIRNTDDSSPIYIHSAKYYDTMGKPIRNYAESPIILPPLATLEYIIGLNDTAGGSGANFIVEWMSDRIVSHPIIECVTIGTQSQQGVSFISVGRVID